MSLPRCIDNLLHAAALDATLLPPSRVVQLPVLTARVAEVVAAASAGVEATVRYEPVGAIERLFGRQPPLWTPRARGLGFLDDGSLVELAARATPQAWCTGKHPAWLIHPLVDMPTK